MDECRLSTNVFKLVWDAWENHSQKNPKGEAIIHWDVITGSFRWTYGNLWESALKVADYLIKNGVAKGDICALMIRHNMYFYPIYMGVSLIGAIPAVLAHPNARLHPDKFINGLVGMAQKSGLDWILTEHELGPIIKPIITELKVSIKGIFYPLECLKDWQSIEPDSSSIKESRSGIDENMPFLLQHSSGTTGLQKAVVLSHRAVLEHVKRYSEAIKLCEKDKIISWLPLYHDMGLIAAFHLPLIYGIPLVLIDPLQWVVAPRIFFYAISEEKCTLTWLPNFAYNFMADRVLDKDMENIRLDSMRMFINCSEVVRAQSHDKFFHRFKEYGVKKQSLAACYAMAETTFAVTQTTPGLEASSVAVSRDALSRQMVEIKANENLAKICVSSGKPISGCAVKITDENGKELSEDRIGRIIINSVSLFDGYRNDLQRTRHVLKDGWYSSGDLGFCHGGEYFVVGREDDVIIIAGNNIYPEDIEDAASKVSGVIPGRAVAFGVDNEQLGTQDICVVVETPIENESEKESLKLALMQAGMSIDVTISQIHLVPPRWLIKSSSGKPSRRANRERILSGKLQEDAKP
ncbi:MAG: AMP-binding protein [Candidatus Omnitrophota bacterium]